MDRLWELFKRWLFKNPALKAASALVIAGIVVATENFLESLFWKYLEVRFGITPPPDQEELGVLFCAMGLFLFVVQITMDFCKKWREQDHEERMAELQLEIERVRLERERLRRGEAPEGPLRVETRRDFELRLQMISLVLECLPSTVYLLFSAAGILFVLSTGGSFAICSLPVVLVGGYLVGLLLDRARRRRA